MSACVLRHGEREEAEFGLLCKRHRNQLDSDTREIADLIVDTQRILDGGAPAEESPKTRYLKQPEAPAPGNLGIMSLFDRRTAVARIPGTPQNPDGDQSEPMPAVFAVIASWVLLFADERPLTTILPKSVLAQLELLRRHHQWACVQPWIDDYALELTELRRALKAAVNDHTHTACGTCDLPTADRARCGGVLLAENGTGVIRCTDCKSTWITPQERARLAVRQ